MEIGGVLALGGAALTFAYSIQCSGSRGVFAMVHNGKLTCGGNRLSVHSMQAVSPGMMTLTLPLKPAEREREREQIWLDQVPVVTILNR